jgi:MFS family permease
MDERFNAPAWLIGTVLSVGSLTTAATSTQLGRITARFSERTLLHTSFIVYATALAVIAFAPALPLLFVSAILFGIAQSMNIPNIFSLLNELAPSENRGAFMSINGMTLRIGQTIGPLLMASTAGLLGFTGAYIAAAGLAILSFFVILLLVR